MSERKQIPSSAADFTRRQSQGGFVGEGSGAPWAGESREAFEERTAKESAEKNTTADTEKYSSPIAIDRLRPE